MMKHYLSLYTLFMGLLVLPAITEAQLDDVLFLADPDVKSKHDARRPITGSTQEWDILFNSNLIEEKRTYFSLRLPESQETHHVMQTHFQRYEYGAQWVGKITSETGADSGDVIINKINDRVFGIIYTDDASYEIYTDTRVGTRLAKIEGGSYFEGDTVESEDTSMHSKHESIEHVTTQLTQTYKNIPPISTVDVLVVLDNELTNSDLPYIQSSFMTANHILQNSGENAVDSPTDISGGVPLRLNMVGPVYLEIPENANRILGVQGEDQNFVNLTSGLTPISIKLKEELVRHNADYVTVFLGFDPSSVSNGVCGQGKVPGPSSLETTFAFSVTTNTIRCSRLQYVLLHELMHNFGSRHDSRPDDSTIPFVTYARGINIPERNDSAPFSTVMAGCVIAEPGFNPTTTNCNRIPKLSSPHDEYNEASLGAINTVDNARFLSECEPNGPCRREDIANRDAINANIDFDPIASITTPSVAVANITVTNAYQLTAEVFSDSDIVAATWKIYKNSSNSFDPPQLIQEGTGIGPNYSFITDAFNEVGEYRVDFTVTDDNNVTSLNARFVNASVAIPELTSAKAVYGNRYSIELLGDKFNSDASVVVSDPANILPDDTYSGHLIYNRNDHPTLGVDRMTFPIVDPDYQAALRNGGLCFKVLNNTTESNEMCAVRPVWPGQGLFLGSAVESYSAGQDLQPEAYIVKGSGQIMKLLGNSWKKVAYDHNITANTVLEFDFRSTHQEAEIIGVGVIMSDGSGGNFSQRFWQIHGTQTYGHQGFNNYSGDQIVTYTIPIGQTLTGQVSHLVFVADEDNRVGQNVVFFSPELKLQGADEYDDTVNGPRTFTDDINGRAVPWTDASVNDVVHNLHDQGDVDWTIIYAEDFQVRTELIGTNIQPKISLYKWIAATPNQTLGYYTNITDVLLQTSTNPSVTPIVNLATSSDIYAVKVESPTGQYGPETEYRLIFEPVPGNNVMSTENSLLLEAVKE